MKHLEISLVEEAFSRLTQKIFLTTKTILKTSFGTKERSPMAELNIKASTKQKQKLFKEGLFRKPTWGCVQICDITKNSTSIENQWK